MLLWMDWMMSPMANALATVWFGEAPTSQAACDYAETISPGHCAHVPRDRRGVLLQGPLLGDAAGGLQGRPIRPRRARPRMTGSRPGRISAAADRLLRQRLEYRGLSGTRRRALDVVRRRATTGGDGTSNRADNSPRGARAAAPAALVGVSARGSTVGPAPDSAACSLRRSRGW